MTLSCGSMGLSAYRRNHHCKKEIEQSIVADAVLNLFMYWKFLVCLEIYTSRSAAHYNLFITLHFLFLFECRTIACRRPHGPVARIFEVVPEGDIMLSRRR